MNQYEHIFFDLDNTLWDFSANSKQAMKETIEVLGIGLLIDSFEQFLKTYEEINHSLWQDYHHKKINKTNLITERFRRSFEVFGITNQNWVEINSMYLHHMGLQTKVFPETLETLSYLKTKGYQTYIITNGFKEVQNEKLFNSGLASYFNKVFISEEIGVSKPNREIFEYVLKTVNARKKKSIMIGDSWEIDIEGAISIGLDQIMFLNKDANKIPPDIAARISKTQPFLKQKYGSTTRFIQNINELVTFF
jgi:putative hydrolase of the HAD superfamily